MKRNQSMKLKPPRALRIVATKVKARDLNPGDLFSTGDQFYWDNLDPASLGLKVYIRTSTQAPKEELETEIHRIQVLTK